MKTIKFANKKISATLAEAITDKTLSFLFDTYSKAGEEFIGQSISYIEENAIRSTVKGIGRDSEALLKELGFEIVEIPRGRGVIRVVTL